MLKKQRKSGAITNIRCIGLETDKSGAVRFSKRCGCCLKTDASGNVNGGSFVGTVHDMKTNKTSVLKSGAVSKEYIADKMVGVPGGSKSTKEWGKVIGLAASAMNLYNGGRTQQSFMMTGIADALQKMPDKITVGLKYASTTDPEIRVMVRNILIGQIFINFSVTDITIKIK